MKKYDVERKEALRYIGRYRSDYATWTDIKRNSLLKRNWLVTLAIRGTFYHRRTSASSLVQLRKLNVTIVIVVFVNSNFPNRCNFVPFDYGAGGDGKRRKGASVSVICEGTENVGEMDAGERKR